MKASAKQLRITPRKLNLIAKMIRNRDAEEAMDILRFTPKKGAKILYKVLKSAIANAENNFKQERNLLYIKEAVVNKGITLKRSVPISKGRVHPILKRNAHVRITVGIKEETENKATKAAKNTNQSSSAVQEATRKSTEKPAQSRKVTKANSSKIKKVKA